jgi:hypothetical protein
MTDEDMPADCRVPLCFSDGCIPECTDPTKGCNSVLRLFRQRGTPCSLCMHIGDDHRIRPPHRCAECECLAFTPTPDGAA